MWPFASTSAEDTHKKRPASPDTGVTPPPKHFHSGNVEEKLDALVALVLDTKRELVDLLVAKVQPLEIALGAAQAELVAVKDKCTALQEALDNERAVTTQRFADIEASLEVLRSEVAAHPAPPPSPPPPAAHPAADLPRPRPPAPPQGRAAARPSAQAAPKSAGQQSDPAPDGQRRSIIFFNVPYPAGVPDVVGLQAWVVDTVLTTTRLPIQQLSVMGKPGQLASQATQSFKATFVDAAQARVALRMRDELHVALAQGMGDQAGRVRADRSARERELSAQLRWATTEIQRRGWWWRVRNGIIEYNSTITFHSTERTPAGRPQVVGWGAWAPLDAAACARLREEMTVVPDAFGTAVGGGTVGSDGGGAAAARPAPGTGAATVGAGAAAPGTGASSVGGAAPAPRLGVATRGAGASSSTSAQGVGEASVAPPAREG